ncbi:MAG: hypothetical protein NTZ69_05935 [Bacteroidia bacterium]|nr:hypothetical protein [Bacteroidia bacterium]
MRIPTLILTIFFSLTLFAQKRNHDVVYLKNGSILRGTVVLIDPGKFIKLKTPDRNVWVFEQEKIDSIVQTSKVQIPQKNGYFNLTEMGVLAGNSANYKKNPFTLMNISSWKFENGFSTGIGVGVEFFNETYLPVVADFRYFIRKAGAMPFVSLQGGYSIPLGGTYTLLNLYYLSSSIYRPTPQPTNIDVSARGGWLVNPAIGIQTPLNENLALTFSAGYRMMRQRYGKNDTYKLDVDYNRLSLKVGLLFK